MASNAKLNSAAKAMLTGKTIIDVGNDYITIDNGTRIYLSEQEILDLNPDDEPERITPKVCILTLIVYQGQEVSSMPFIHEHDCLQYLHENFDRYHESLKKIDSVREFEERFQELIDYKSMSDHWRTGDFIQVNNNIIELQPAMNQEWEVDHQLDGSIFVVEKGSPDDYIAAIQCLDDGPAGDREEEIAKLIAAAPAMWRALVKISEH